MLAKPHTASTIATLDEARQFLDANPSVAFVEMIFTPMSGVSLGKRLRRNEILPLYESGRFMPGSILVSDVTGQDCYSTGIVWEDGDADRVVRPAPNTLVLAPWLDGHAAQLITSLYERDGTPNGLDPRHVLSQVVARFAADGLTPVVACELEFYLVDPVRAPDGGIQLARPLKGGDRPRLHNEYGLRDMEDFSAFLNELWAGADVQGIPLGCAISEYAPGQFELTLEHRADALRAADEAVMYKRLAKGVAARNGCEATFMAKPFGDRVGSGLHLHVSVNDGSGNNIFGSEDPAGSPELRHAIGGLKEILADSMAILAPNANSYRRFRTNSYAPVTTAWGIDNRTVALRVPAGAGRTRHIEQRVAGADANPYLALAALLAGVHHGLSGKIGPGPPIVGNGYAVAEERDHLPINWFASVDRFQQSQLMRDYLGSQFVDMFACVKRTEQDRFYGVVSPLDYDWYLKNA